MPNSGCGFQSLQGKRLPEMPARVFQQPLSMSDSAVSGL